MGNLALKQEFARLFLLSTQKQSLAMDLAGNTINGRWNLNFRRALFVWDNEQLDRLHQRLIYVVLDPSRNDSMQWLWSSDQTFSVRSAYAKLEELIQTPNDPLNVVCKNLFPTEVEVCSWQALQDSIATRSVM